MAMTLTRRQRRNSGEDIHFLPVGFDLSDSCLTIPDLRRLYEAVRCNFTKFI